MSESPDTLGARVLIVDDEPHEIAVLEVMLKAEGFVLVTAASGEEALRLVGQQPPDLILLDVSMPGISGYEVAMAIKADVATKNIPIVIVTAFDDHEARLLGLSAGAEEFLSKPVDRAELCVRVRNLLRLKAYGDFQQQCAEQLEVEVSHRTAELIASERLYRSTFDAAPVGIVHVGLDGRWLRVNQRMCELLGYSRDALMSEAIQELQRAEEAPGEPEAIARLVAGTLRHCVIDERRYARQAGTFLWGRANLSVHRHEDGQFAYLIVVIEDITEQRAFDAHLRQANRMEAIGTLAAGVAHDFNNLLSVILGYTGLLITDLKVDDPLRLDLEEVHKAGLRATKLARELLAFGRRQSLRPVVVDLGHVVSAIRATLARLVGAEVTLSVVVSPRLENVYADPGQVEQVILNLVANARDAMPHGGTVSVACTNVTVEEYDARDSMMPGSYVELSVTDTGTGMAPVTKDRIFEPFFTTKRQDQRTGLGLSTVYGIVKQSGGHIRVDSELGNGTRFRIYLPKTDRAPEAPQMEVVASGKSRGSETILLVEDEDQVRTLMRTVLRKQGYVVLEAQNGGEALLLCEQFESEIHLLVTDVMMPRMNGWQLAARLAPLRPQMKVIYVSGYDETRAAHPGGESVDFLQKPITPGIFIAHVREVLDRTSALTEPSVGPAAR